MIINVDRLPEEGLTICNDFEFFSGDLLEENAEFLKPVYIEVTIKKKGEEIFLKGNISTILQFSCCRCLTPFEYPVDSGFDLVYLPEELDEVKEQLETDDMNKFFYYSRKIDLEELILEQLNLTLPIRPLCNEKCQGLCPICGKVIASGDCSCVAHESDSRLGKLKIYLRDKS